MNNQMTRKGLRPNPFIQGGAAYRLNRDRKSNPYYPDDPRCVAWDTGWTDARKQWFGKELQRLFSSKPVD